MEFPEDVDVNEGWLDDTEDVEGTVIGEQVSFALILIHVHISLPSAIINWRTSFSCTHNSTNYESGWYIELGTLVFLERDLSC